MRSALAILLMATCAGCTTLPVLFCDDAGACGDAEDVASTDADVGATDAMDSQDTTDVAIDSGPSDAADGGVLVRTIRQIANLGAPMHPPSPSEVEVDEVVVAISARTAKFIGTSGRCSYTLWVEEPAGGPFSGMELFEIEPADMVDAGNPCAGTSAVIPPDVQIGSAISRIVGQYSLFCPSGSTCPMGAAAEIDVSRNASGSITLTGTMAAEPAPAVSLVTDLNGIGATLAPSDLARQNTLVVIDNSYQQQVPAGGNFNDLIVSIGATDTTHEITVIVDGYAAAACHRTNLTALGVGNAVGPIVGILTFEFGSWYIQPRVAADLSNQSSGCSGASDAGGSDASAD